ncbi:hypothetical protein [Paraburkholderia dinghuensis]|uniref:Glycosyltransferase RgtA/B/C/D-like domain-containing protein n=1 Tax=Paraburkholderia dinghuensis TaxID=2305225 RepID=A0A3N6MWH4_9BURK|nr:hypothetical protein [Paraburkholderia dinghuensis]RQH08354.1 hypothetical protein D1Y85_04870 [Paraburkholderia dinghuensis]
MILAHIWNIITGAGAGLILIAWLYVLCIAATPPKTKGAVYSVPHGTAIGASLAVLWFWYSLRLQIPASAAAIGLVFLTIILLICRRKAIAINLKNIINSDSLFWVGLYVFFYITNYIFTLPPATPDRLPIARIFNNDIFNYINIAQYLQKLGQSHIAGFSLTQPLSPMVAFTPAAFYIINGFSIFFNAETMRAAMPAIIAMAALAGCAITWVIWRNFEIPRSLAAAVGVLFVSGPFLRYIVGNYFLSTIIAELFVILLLGKTAELLFDNKQRKWNSVVCSFAPYHLLLFFTYPPLYVIGTGLQGVFVLLSLFSVDKQDISASLLLKVRDASKWMAAIVVSSVVPMILDPWHARDMFTLLFFISDKYTFGWPLDFIGPAAIFGLPTGLEIHARHSQVLNVIALTVLFATVLFFSARTKQRSGSRHVFLLLSAFSFLLYFAYFFRTGPSYQQWKLASYIPLFLAPFALASVAGIAAANSGVARRVPFISVSVGLLLLGLNVAYHYRTERALDEFPASYANLRALDMIGNTNELYVDMLTMSSTFFPVYFVHSKTLHLLSHSYYPQEALSPEKITPATPLFIEGDTCPADADSVSIAGVGCLYFRAPSLKLGADYSFKKNVPALYINAGMSGIEPWGRWSDGKRLKIGLLMDDEIASTDGVRYLNLHVQPYPAANSGIQNVTAVWGQGERSNMIVRGPQWVSIPFRKSDLSGYENRQLLVELQLPNATSPMSLDPSSGDTRELGVGFTNLSVTKTPLEK